jgi:hypothetical protein
MVSKEEKGMEVGTEGTAVAAVGAAVRVAATAVARTIRPK